MEIILVLGVVLTVFMLVDLNRMKYEMEQDRIRQDMLFKAIDDYMAQLEKDQKEFANKACKHDWEE